MSNISVRTKGAVLLACRGGEYYFVDSVFRDGSDFYGCTGFIVNPVSADWAEYLLCIDSVEERYEDYWAEHAKGMFEDDCPDCEDDPNEDGCDYCDYKSLRDFCYDIIDCEGISAMLDDSWGCDAYDALKDIVDDMEYTDCSGCGRIFGSFNQDEPTTPDYFDEIYNLKALVACLAYEDGAVSYDYAVRVIFGK